jgi:hypothetical protein
LAKRQNFAWENSNYSMFYILDLDIMQTEYLLTTTNNEPVAGFKV